MLIVVLLSVLNPLRAANADGTIQWAMLVFSLCGGLALFLFGMEQMSEGMKKSTGEKYVNCFKKTISNVDKQ